MFTPVAGGEEKRQIAFLQYGKESKLGNNHHIWQGIIKPGFRDKLQSAAAIPAVSERSAIKSTIIYDFPVHSNSPVQFASLKNSLS